MRLHLSGRMLNGSVDLRNRSQIQYRWMLLFLQKSCLKSPEGNQWWRRFACAGVHESLAAYILLESLKLSFSCQFTRSSRFDIASLPDELEACIFCLLEVCRISNCWRNKIGWWRLAPSLCFFNCVNQMYLIQICLRQSTSGRVGNPGLHCRFKIRSKLYELFRFGVIKISSKIKLLHWFSQVLSGCKRNQVSNICFSTLWGLDRS